MPKKVAREIVRLQRQFLWGGNKEGRAMALVKWELVQQSKEKGGLGVGDIEVKNVALLLKWWWKFATAEDQMWKRVINAIHNEGQALLPLCTTRKRSGSGLWQSLKNLVQDQRVTASQVFWQNLKLMVGNGNKVRFWEDYWTQDRPLMLLFPELYELSSQRFYTINNMGWFEGDVWRWTLAWQGELTQNEIHSLDSLSEILSQNCPRQDQVDTILWQNKNIFSVKELQRSVSKVVEVDNIVCTVWKKLAPPKVEFFMWLALLGKLSTRQRLYEKGMLQEDQTSCPLCAVHPESLDHILLSCSFSQQIWLSISAEFGQNLIAAATFKEHYRNWMSVPGRKGLQKKVWILSFFAVAWNIWQTRNEVVFQNKVYNQEIMLQDIRRRMAYWMKAWKDKLPYSEDVLAKNLGDI